MGLEAFRRLAFIVALALVASAAPAATDPPKKATKLVLSLVRAYNQCLVANTNHDLPLPFVSCAPAVPNTSTLELGPKGHGRVTISLSRGPDIKVVTKVYDVLQGGLPFNGTIYVAAGTRLTDKNCMVAGDCTQIDIPPGVPNIPVTCLNGTCKSSMKLNDPSLIPGLVVGGKEANVEIQSVVVLDSLSNVFLVPGIFVP